MVMIQSGNRNNIESEYILCDIDIGSDLHNYKYINGSSTASIDFRMIYYYH